MQPKLRATRHFLPKKTSFQRRNKENIAENIMEDLRIGEAARTIRVIISQWKKCRFKLKNSSRKPAVLYSQFILCPLSYFKIPQNSQ